MNKRFVSLWFRTVMSDWMIRRDPVLRNLPFVLTAADRGQVYITEGNALAEGAGIRAGMVLADACALEPRLKVFDDDPALAEKILGAMADWCLRYTPVTALCELDGLWLDVTGCAHLLGGEKPFLRDIVVRFRGFGYAARAAMADTPGAAWAVARFGRDHPLIAPGAQKQALAGLPPAALRLPPATLDRLRQLGIHRVDQLYGLPRSTLARRFGIEICTRLDQALGDIAEPITPKEPVAQYQARLDRPDGIATAEGIARATRLLIETLCRQLDADHKGLRRAELLCIRLDGQTQRIAIGTGKPSRSPPHLFRLFEEKLSQVEPDLGIETFFLSAPLTDALVPGQGMFLDDAGNDEAGVLELLDRIGNRLGSRRLFRFSAEESHWPERAALRIAPADQAAAPRWPVDRPRPLHLLPDPEKIEVMAPVPDYPPMLFRHHGHLHRIRHAEGPERIEAEWWLKPGELRDYYRLEDEEGRRYWVFRDGHYHPDAPSSWFLHGIFA